MSHTKYLGSGRSRTERRGHVVFPSVATHTIEWIQKEKKSRSGVSHIYYVPVKLDK